MPRGTALLPGGATQLSGGATPPLRGVPLSEATPPPGEILRQHLGQPSRGSVWKKEIRSLEGVPPLGRVAPLEETLRLGREGPPREARSRKEAPRLKLKLLMKSVLVLLPALMQADKSQLKENYLPPGRSALPALGMTVQRSRGSPRSPVPPSEEWPPPPPMANGEMTEEPPPPHLVRTARGPSSKTGEVGGREGTQPLRRHRPLMGDCATPWPATIGLAQEKIPRGRDHMSRRGGGGQLPAGAARGDSLLAAGRRFLLPPLPREPPMHRGSTEPTGGLGRIAERSRGVTKLRARKGEREARDTCS